MYIKSIDKLVEHYENLYNRNVAYTDENSEFILIRIQERLIEDENTLETNGFVEVF